MYVRAGRPAFAWPYHALEMAFTLLIYLISNEIIFIGLRSSKDYYKRPGGRVGI